MASIFTYDPEPPRVSSPWQAFDNSPNIAPTKLEAEPQEGPTEYKLHLLLRPRQAISAVASKSPRSGTFAQRSLPLLGSATNASVVASHGDTRKASTPSPSSTPSQQSRQQRLQSLTTQLFWRLQQSSPCHSSSATRIDLIVPLLPDASNSSVLDVLPIRPNRVLPGLEESHGALYEIGVADDGTLIGLMQDEMEESLTNLRAMAASLGCDVQVLRMYVVGDCEVPAGVENGIAQKETLWVAEAFVKPSSHMKSSATNGQSLLSNASTNETTGATQSLSEQLRISLIGATTSGKTSLLGTLSSSILDDRRGKSRLNLLKHRHELASGVTSSIANELVGYDPVDKLRDLQHSVHPPAIINFATGNISCWTDVHSRTERGRLVFFSDSAGHPRYRRTMLRSLIGWAPHWVLLCIAGNDGEDAEAETEKLSSEVSQSYLDLCLKLQLPVVVVITKLDRASSSGLRQTLTKILTTVKAAGRVPLPLFKGASLGSDAREVDPHTISNADWSLVKDGLNDMRTEDAFQTVPILLTSAANGTGIGHLHSLLCQLPVPPRDGSTRQSSVSNGNPKQSGSNSSLFHIEEVFAFPTAGSIGSTEPESLQKDCVLSGHVQHGEIRVGDILQLGPFSADEATDRSKEHQLSSSSNARTGGDRDLLAAQHRRSPSASSPRGSPRQTPLNILSESEHEWQQVRVISVRNLRSPVRTLLEGQVGTVGVAPLTETAHHRKTHGAGDTSSTLLTALGIPKVRKGMVLGTSGNLSGEGLSLRSYSGFIAQFPDSALSLRTAVGAHVTVYFGSVRAIARVEKIGTAQQNLDHSTAEVEEGLWGLDDDEHPVVSDESVEVQVQFLAAREFIGDSSQVLLIPGSEKSSGRLESYVGQVVKGVF